MSSTLVRPVPRSPGQVSTPAPMVSVLIVDDNAGKRLALRAVLLPLGYGVVEADSAVAALRCLMAQDFAVILLDVQMPTTDGFEAAALIRQREQSETTPIIFVTSHGPDEIDMTAGYAEGAVDFLFAPVLPNALRAKVTAFANLFVKAELLAARALELQTSADELRYLTDAAPIGIFQTDADQRYVYTNPRWTEITGVPADEALGEDWSSIIFDKEGAARADLAKLQNLFHRFEYLRPDGQSRVVVLNWRTIRDGDDAGLGSVGTLADVTAEAAAEASLRCARDAAVEATAMQRNFTTSASHELRTPTAAILGFVEEVLESESLMDADRSMLDVAYRNAQRLSRLIDDLLILDQPEITTAMMQLESTDFVPVVEGIVDDFATVANSSGIALTMTCEPLVPALVVDPMRLGQALTNLVGNALKFTPHGGAVTVTIANAPDAVRISVIDTGCGMRPEEFSHIFERFYRSQSAVEASVRGTGLGLPIAKGMIEAQNGTIEVSSELGSGSTFTVVLPTATTQAGR